MQNKKIVLPILILISLFIFSCSNDSNDKIDTEETDFSQLNIADDFMFNTLRDVSVDINVKDGNGISIPNVRFDIYDKSPAEGGNALYAGASDESGKFQAIIPLPTFMTKVVIVGFMSEAEVNIVGNQIVHTFGADNTDMPIGKAITPPKSVFAYVSPYDADGTPLGMDRDIIPTGFLNKINATLPERQSLFVTHPDYLTSDVELNAVIINQETDIWVTFVHEGAGYFNSLAYYTYPVGNPPVTTDDIDTLRVIFPNVSYVGEGGGLVSGDRVFLGHFEVGTVLSWTLVANGWRNGQVNPRLDTWYSNYYLNHNGIQQSIQVWDEEYDKLVFAFEDQNVPSGDNDYNDTVFYLTGNPTGTIDTTGIPPIDIVDDDDGDGISNIFDDFPQDPDRAFETNDHTNSTLAFEDLWPDQGDYDFNDMVLDYNFFYHTAPGNKIRHIIAEFTLKAVGASFQNGFAVQLPMPSSMIESITIIDGSDPLTYSAIVSPANFAPFLEANNDGTVVLFNHTNELITQTPGHYVNTEAGIAYVTPVEFALDIKLIGDNILTSDWQWQPPFNPFIFVNGDRGHEVHLADYAPTSQVDYALFHIGDDDTQAPLARYYRTANNLPWVLNVASSWDHMYEKAEITKGYLNFKSWAESYGTINTDWYEDNPGNRNWEKIYLRP